MLKFEYIEENLIEDSEPVRELSKMLCLILIVLDPEIERIKSMTCRRIRNFLLKSFNQLKKPKSNFQIL